MRQADARRIKGKRSRVRVGVGNGMGGCNQKFDIWNEVFPVYISSMRHDFA